jgi:hypothetical protein
VRPLLLAVLALALLPAGAAAGEPDATAPGYALDLTGSDGGFRWRGHETLTVTNPGMAPLERIWVRLWGNGARGCARTSVRVTGVTGGAAGRLLKRCTAQEVVLALPLAPGGRGTVGFDVDIRVPRGVQDRFGRGGRRMALVSNAVPALAHLEDGRWRLDRWYGGGEAWTYPAAEYRVAIHAPPGISVAAPGVRQPDGSRLLEHGRDYSWAAGRMRQRSATVEGIAVTAWGPAAGRARQVTRALAIAKRRLPRLVALFGPFGWPDLQIVVTNATAMEHSALVMTPAVDYVMVHEMAHEWWFGSVGDDQARSPWLDEAFATYAEEAVRGQKPFCRRPGPEARLVTRGVAFFRTRLLDYGIVYFEGACLLDRLEHRMGRRTFRAALRDYAVAHQYGWSTDAAFRAAMDAASPEPLGALWRRYRVQ